MKSKFVKLLLVPLALTALLLSCSLEPRNAASVGQIEDLAGSVKQKNFCYTGAFGTLLGKSEAQVYAKMEKMKSHFFHRARKNIF